MNISGHLLFEGGGQLKTARFENLAADPSSPYAGQVWYNTVSKTVKYFDGTTVIQIAVGNNLNDYLLLAGGTMTGDIVLAGAPTLDLHPSTKKYTDDADNLKENILTGAASSVAHTNLDTNKAVVSDGSGKVAAHSSVTATEIGYLAGVTSGVQAQIDSKEPNIGYTTVNKAGDSMTGNLAFGGTKTVTGLTSPTNSSDAVRLIDLETALSGLDFQPDVLNIQVDNTLDPTATPADGARYIVTDTANLHANFGTIADVGNNDIVEYVGSAFVVKYDVSVKGPGALAWNRAGTYWQRFDGTNWADFGGLAGVTAGVGLTKTGNLIEVNLGAGIVQLPTDEVGIDVKPDGGLDIVDPTTGLHSTLTDAVIAIKLDGVSMVTSSSGLKIQANGVTATEIATSSISDGLQGAGGTAITVKANTGITVTGSGVGVDTTWADTNYVNRTGSTMTGALILAAAPAIDLEAATKKYVDDAETDLTTLLTNLTNRYAASFVVADSSTPATTHVITHNMGTKFVNVTVVNASDEVIIPDSIVYTNDNTVTVGLLSAAAIKVAVSGLKVVV